MRGFDTRLIKDTYNRLSDGISKEIYENRLLYSFTGDYKYIQNIVGNTSSGGFINSQIKMYKRFILFGGGIWGANILWIYQDLDWICALDNNPKTDLIKSRNKGFSEKEVVLKVKKYYSGYKIDKDTAIIISSRLYHQEIKKQLLTDGISEGQIIDAGKEIDDMSKRQYFDLAELVKEENEVFVDAGAFDGETSIQFDKCYDGRYSEIIAFEPDLNNIQKFRKRIDGSRCHNITLIQKGLWNEKCELSFHSIGNGSSTISEEGTQRILVEKLDDMIDIGKRISFIKMDLEGAEYKALLGAQKTIEKHHPKLAISIYHKPEDIWEIPEIIASFYRDYKFYLRHYSIAASETVLYAL